MVAMCISSLDDGILFGVLHLVVAKQYPLISFVCHITCYCIREVLGPVSGKGWESDRTGSFFSIHEEKGKKRDGVKFLLVMGKEPSWKM